MASKPNVDNLVRGKGWKDSKLYRFLLAAFFSSTTFRISRDIGGDISHQPWWGIALTLAIAVALPLYVWHNCRVLERE